MKTLAATNVVAFNQETPTLRVQMVYEDAETGLRAKRALESLAGHLELDADFNIGLSRFDLLREKAFRELAAREAEGADILLLSAHGNETLPPGVLAWLEEWLIRNAGEPRALVVSLDPDVAGSAEANGILSALQTVAEPAGVDMFPHFGRTMSSGWQTSADDIHYRVETRTALLDEALHRVELDSHRYWGINE